MVGMMGGEVPFDAGIDPTRLSQSRCLVSGTIALKPLISYCSLTLVGYTAGCALHGLLTQATPMSVIQYHQEQHMSAVLSFLKRSPVKILTQPNVA